MGNHKSLKSDNKKLTNFFSFIVTKRHFQIFFSVEIFMMASLVERLASWRCSEKKKKKFYF